MSNIYINKFRIERSVTCRIYGKRRAKFNSSVNIRWHIHSYITKYCQHPSNKFRDKMRWL